MKKALFLILALFSFSVSAQSCEQADNDLSKAYSDMFRYGTYSGGYDDEKLTAATETFNTVLKAYWSQLDSMQCTFTKLTANDEITLLASTDNKVRALSWNTNNSGSMIDYDNAVQYLDKTGKLNLDVTIDGISLIKNIFTTTLNNETYYWFITYSIADGSTHGAGATLYQINEQGLVPANLIKTKKLTNNIGFIFSPLAEDRPEEESNRDFRYDEQSKTLSFPVVIKTDEYPNGKVTDKRIQYRFDGQYFVRIKN